MRLFWGLMGMSKVRKSGKLVHGFGVNDADYTVQKKELVNGKFKTLWNCPFYKKWADMIRRCYSKSFLEKWPNYKGCSVCDEWKSFMAFRKWMMVQDWEGKQLDKDFLVRGNRKYSPETCVFIHQKVNTFLNDHSRVKGGTLIGTTWHKRDCKFVSQCRNPFTGKQERLGYHDTEISAHLAWKKRKHEIACELADSEYVTDERVRVALRNWYK